MNTQNLNNAADDNNGKDNANINGAAGTPHIHTEENTVKNPTVTTPPVIDPSLKNTINDSMATAEEAIGGKISSLSFWLQIAAYTLLLAAIVIALVYGQPYASAWLSTFGFSEATMAWISIGLKVTAWLGSVGASLAYSIKVGKLAGRRMFTWLSGKADQALDGNAIVAAA